MTIKRKLTPEEFRNLTEKEQIEYLDQAKVTKNIYAVYDRINKTFGTIIVNDQDGTMVREFEDATKSEKSGLMYQHPEDFELWGLGEINMENGEIFSCTRIIHKGTRTTNKDNK